MAACSKKTKTVTLESCDGRKFELEENIALQFSPVKFTIEDGGETWIPDTVIVLPVTGEILAKVVAYCEEHAKPDVSKDASKQWVAKFVKDDDYQTVIDLIKASYYLDLKGLSDLTNQTLANMIKGKSVEEVRAIFKIENDFTPEMEAELRAENAWAFV